MSLVSVEIVPTRIARRRKNALSDGIRSLAPSGIVDWRCVLKKYFVPAEKLSLSTKRPMKQCVRVVADAVSVIH